MYEDDDQIKIQQWSDLQKTRNREEGGDIIQHVGENSESCIKQVEDPKRRNRETTKSIR